MPLIRASAASSRAWFRHRGGVGVRQQTTSAEGQDGCGRDEFGGVMVPRLCTCAAVRALHVCICVRVCNICLRGMRVMYVDVECT